MSNDRSPRSRPPSSSAEASLPLELRLCALFLGLVGVLGRALPLLDPGGRALRQFPTEDGYLMLTIARNFAAGLGFSTAQGTLPTNGTQPLATALYALGFLAAGGERERGVWIALAVQLLVAIASALLLHRLGLALLGRERRARAAALLGASAWFATVLVQMHGMNCLETGLYGLALIGLALLLVRGGEDPFAPWSTRRALLLGLGLGLVLWVRLDAVFLVAALCLARLFLGPGPRWEPSFEKLRQASVTGALAVLVIAPWLVHNRLRFGSFMPISGSAESYAAGLGANLARLPAVLAEYVLVVLPIPSALEQRPAIVGGGLALCLALLLFLARSARGARPSARGLGLVIGLFGLGLSAYYGLLFGAGWFLSRYFFALSPFLALCFGAVLAGPFLALRPPALRVLAVAGLAALVLYPNLRLHRKGLEHEHFQVVEWVRSNVGEEEWVGAVQTGTLGFYHDRTINLDGKVNPEALAAVRARRIPEYVLEKRIAYIADWVGVADWVELPVLAPHFELLVRDPARNLAVLRRDLE